MKTVASGMGGGFAFVTPTIDCRVSQFIRMQAHAFFWLCLPITETSAVFIMYGEFRVFDLQAC